MSMEDKNPMSEMLGDVNFKDFVQAMTQQIVTEIANDLKFGKVDINDEVVTSSIIICLQDFSFPMLRSLNFVWNGKNEERFYNVNAFIEMLEDIYFKTQDKRNENNEQ